MGERALRRHDPAEAIERLDRALDQAPDFPRLELFAASEALATAWRRQGNDLAALRVLEAAAQRRPRLTDAGFLIGAFGRLRILTGLARLYRQLGRTNDAVSIEEEVLGSLRFADPDHPLVLRITEGRRLEVELDPDRRLDDWTASSSRDASPALGIRRLGHYDVTALIGEGGALLRQPRSTVRGSADSVAEWTVAAAADPEAAVRPAWGPARVPAVGVLDVAAE